MSKPLTISLGLAAVLGLCSIGQAGGPDPNCTTCGLASPQGVVASPQGVVASGQCGGPACAPVNYCEPCAKKQRHFKMPKFHMPKLEHKVCYEWVLKKKHSFSLHRQQKCQEPACETCGGPGGIYPTSQVAPSGQYAAPSGQYAAPSGQYAAPQGQYAAPQASVYGAGQHAFLPARGATTIASAPAEMAPSFGGEDVPPAPEVRGNTTSLLPSLTGN